MAQPMIGAEERSAVDRVLRSGSLTQGPEVAAFETEFSELVDSRHCVALNSGTSALHVTLLSLGVGPGDDVIVPSFTFAATANAVKLVGAQPVFVDIDPETYCLDPDAVDAAITARTAAIMPVHLYGHPADTARIGAIAQRHGLLVVEDAAQAHAASAHGKPVGSIGDAAAFSFYPTKNMTSGEGGMAVFADEDAARTARLLRNQGMELPYENEIVGFNLRMTDIHAAVGRVQLGRLEDLTQKRRSNAAALSYALEASDAVQAPVERPGYRHVFHQYTIRSEQRDRIREVLELSGVESRVFYPTGVHRLPAFTDQSGAEPRHLPETDRASAQVLSLPVGPHVVDARLQYLIETVAKVVTEL
jgi:dTDP-4-amino-4,6-dideoxygalactose transaminase